MEAPIQFISRFPSDLLGCAIYCFLDLHDLIRFDKACVDTHAHAIVEQALVCLSPMELACDDLFMPKLEWAMNHKLSLKSVELKVHQFDGLRALTDHDARIECVHLSFELSSEAYLSQLCSLRAEDYQRSNALGFTSCARITFPGALPLTNLTKLQVWSDHPAEPFVVNLMLFSQRLTELTVHFTQIEWSHQFYDCLIARGGNLTHLEISGSGDDAALIQAIGMGCTALKTLQLEAGLAISEEDMDLRPIAVGCTKLVSLSVVSYTVTVASLSQVLRSCRQLTELHISAVPLTDALLSVLAQDAHSLRELSATWGNASDLAVRGAAPLWRKLNYLGIHYVDEPALSTALSLLSEVQKVHLYCRSNQDSEIRASWIEALQSTSKHLTSLYVSNPLSIEATTALANVLVGCGNLQTLCAARADAINDAVLWQLGRYCAKLHTLIIPGREITDIGISALANGCHWLREVRMSKCTALTDVAITALEQCTSLKILSLPLCTNASAAALTRLVRSCRKLESLFMHRSVVTAELSAVLANAFSGRLEVNCVDRGMP